MFGRFKGWKTVTSAGLLFAIGVLNVLGSIDLSPIVGYFIEDQRTLGAVMACLGVFFATMRFITTTPIFRRGEHEDGDGHI